MADERDTPHFNKMAEKLKYKADDPGKLKSWEKIAKNEIYKWLTNEAYEKQVTET